MAGDVQFKKGRRRSSGWRLMLLGVFEQFNSDDQKQELKGAFDLSLPVHLDQSLFVFSLDGSATTGESGITAGWCFTAVLPYKPYLFDACGPVVTSPSHSLFVGASACTNNAGELSSIIFACAWLLTLVERGVQQVPVVINFDSQYAANMARGIWQPSANFVLVLRAKGMVQRASEAFELQWQHIFSHTGDVLNERADTLAKLGSRGQLLTSPGTLISPLLLEGAVASGPV